MTCTVKLYFLKMLITFVTLSLVLVGFMFMKGNKAEIYGPQLWLKFWGKKTSKMCAALTIH